jgi:hypothetical protein
VFISLLFDAVLQPDVLKREARHWDSVVNWSGLTYTIPFSCFKMSLEIKFTLEEQKKIRKSGRVDGRGVKEWKSLVATFEQALMYQPKVRVSFLTVYLIFVFVHAGCRCPRYGLCMYISIVFHPLCPPAIRHSVPTSDIPSTVPSELSLHPSTPVYGSTTSIGCAITASTYRQ